MDVGLRPGLRLPVLWTTGEASLASLPYAESVPSPLPADPAARVAPGSCDALWASTLGGLTVGLLGVARHGPHVAIVTHFRVDPRWQHTAVVARLLRRLRAYCDHHSCLKLIVQPGAMPAWMLRLLCGAGFLFSRCRGPAEKPRWEFYLDLYGEPGDEAGPPAASTL